MQSKDVLNPSSCWLPSGFPVLALGSHTTGVDKSKPTKQKIVNINSSIRSMRLFKKIAERKGPYFNYVITFSSIFDQLKYPCLQFLYSTQ